MTEKEFILCGHDSLIHVVKVSINETFNVTCKSYLTYFFNSDDGKAHARSNLTQTGRWEELSATDETIKAKGRGQWALEMVEKYGWQTFVDCIKTERGKYAFLAGTGRIHIPNFVNIRTLRGVPTGNDCKKFIELWYKYDGKPVTDISREDMLFIEAFLAIMIEFTTHDLYEFRR